MKKSLFMAFILISFSLAARAQSCFSIFADRPLSRQAQNIFRSYPFLERKSEELRKNWNGTTLSKKTLSVDGQRVSVTTINFGSPEFVVLYRGIGRVPPQKFNPNRSIEENGWEHTYVTTDLEIAKSYSQGGAIVKYLVPAFALSDGKFENAFLITFDIEVQDMTPFVTSVGVFNKKLNKVEWKK